MSCIFDLLIDLCIFIDILLICILGLQLFQNPLSLYYNLMNFYKRFKKIQFLFTFDVKRSRTKWF